MKFSFTLALAATAVATPLAVRDLATAKAVLNDVKTGLNNLQTAASAFKGDPTDLKKAASSLISTVEADTTKINNMTPLSTFDCLGLIQPAKDVGAQGKALAQQLRDRKADIEKAKQCATTHDFLATGATDSQALVDAVVKKVPSSLQDEVKKEAGDVVQTLKDLRDEFGPDKCHDA
ncbi:hypothetical protein VHEMI07753 [[Torrubiella] hemipterigena]|uniref:Cell wall protein n=1 Tax=[Torrubiella] hemipterigena TaxID=1531966 RepID=A0A0A1T4F2_9HYPO|nr:hypothetical protein VHEMI07753 [[Torrubiella] hemipterigena]